MYVGKSVVVSFSPYFSYSVLVLFLVFFIFVEVEGKFAFISGLLLFLLGRELYELSEGLFALQEVVVLA